MANPEPGKGGNKVWGLEHRALLHRAQHGAPGVTRRGALIVQTIAEPETYCLPDMEPWWEPPDRVPFDPAVYLSWPDVSEKYEDPAEADARLGQFTQAPVGGLPPRLSGRQQQVLAVIRDFVTRRGYPPSIREIGDAVGLHSPSSVVYQLDALQAKGLIRRDPLRSRAIQLAAPGGAP